MADEAGELTGWSSLISKMEGGSAASLTPPSRIERLSAKQRTVHDHVVLRGSRHYADLGWYELLTLCDPLTDLELESIAKRDGIASVYRLIDGGVAAISLVRQCRVSYRKRPTIVPAVSIGPNWAMLDVAPPPPSRHDFTRLFQAFSLAKKAGAYIGHGSQETTEVLAWVMRSQAGEWLPKATPTCSALGACLTELTKWCGMLETLPSEWAIVRDYLAAISRAKLDIPVVIPWRIGTPGKVAEKSLR